MDNAADARPVVVGIDGSRAAIAAAVWAVTEASERDVPLRLVYATGSTRPSSAPYEANDIEFEYGETSLRAASAAVEETGTKVKVETEILWGAIEDALIEESRSAAVVCVGSVGIGWVARRVLGSTAAAVAEKAACTVVVVRYPAPTEPADASGVIVVGVDDRPGNDRIVTRALEEARLRKAPLRAVGTWSSQLSGVSPDELERRVADWRRRHPEVDIQPVTTAGGLLEHLVENRDRAVDLVVVGEVDADTIPQIIGPHDRPLVPHGQCSVMVAR